MRRNRPKRKKKQRERKEKYEEKRMAETHCMLSKIVIEGDMLWNPITGKWTKMGRSNSD